MNWKKRKLGEICTKIGSGSTPKGGAAVYVDSGTRFIRSQNVYNLNFDYDGLVCINCTPKSGQLKVEQTSF